MRGGHATQIKIVRFLIAWPGAGFQKAARCAQHRQQTVRTCLASCLLKRNQVLRGTIEIGLPQHPIGSGLDRFQSDQEMRALLDEVSGQNVGHVKLVADFLRIQISAYVLSGDARRANIQGAGISKHVGDFIGQREAKIVDAEIAVQVLQRQHCDCVLRPLMKRSRRDVSETTSHRRQHRDAAGP